MSKPKCSSFNVTIVANFVDGEKSKTYKYPYVVTDPIKVGQRLPTVANYLTGSFINIKK